ncbi:hypothetical protein QUW15_10665 [Desulfovibrio piger]|nr:hypothetical protein [Desulfovibrio piger]
MTTNADTLFSAVRKRTSPLVMALALLAACSPSWAAESGEQAGAAPGGLEIPPLVGGEGQPPSQVPSAAGQGAPQMSPSEGQQQAPAAQPPRKNVPREDIVSGTGQSFGGYSGTWHDPERDETVTTIIAPRQPMTQQPPMYIAPQVYPDAYGNWSQGGGGYYPPQWYPDNRPPRPPHWDQGHRPPRPPHWNPDNRPPRPPYWEPGQRPPHWDQGQRPPRPPYWEPGQRPPRPPHWDQGRPPYPSRPPSWNPGQRPPQGGGIPPSWWRGSGR